MDHTRSRYALARIRPRTERSGSVWNMKEEGVEEGKSRASVRKKGREGEGSERVWRRGREGRWDERRDDKMMEARGRQEREE